MTEILFIVEEAAEGGYIARGVGASIFTEADDLDQLRDGLRDAVRCHLEDADRRSVRPLSGALSFFHPLQGMTMATPSLTPRGRSAPADAPPALSPATMATLRALVAAQVGPSWMEWFAMTPRQRAAALAATPSLTSELRDGA